MRQISDPRTIVKHLGGNLSGGPVSLEFNHDEVTDCVDAEQVDVAAEIRLDLAVDD